MHGIVSQLPAALNHVDLSRHVILILQNCTKTLKALTLYRLSAAEWHCISVADPKYISSFVQAGHSHVQAVIIPNTNPASGSTCWGHGCCHVN